MKQLIDLTDQRFDHWRVLRRGRKKQYWVCICDCGNEREVNAYTLTAKKSTKCKSCLMRVNAFKHGGSPRGQKRSKLYSVWAEMRKRCNNPNCKNYKNYGGRGIKICERWSNFALFAQDMKLLGEPIKGMSLDRINNDGNYELGNVRWATQTEQIRNRRITPHFLWKRENLNVHELAEIRGISYSAMVNRLWNGWPLERAMSDDPQSWDKSLF